MTAYAAATATSTSFEKVRDAASGREEDKPAKVTAQTYRDVLARLFILDDLPAWQPSRNVIAQLALPHKHHLTDPALAGRHEVDVIVERADGKVVAFEVKLARTATDGDVKHLKWLAGELGDDLLDSVVITTGTDAYRRKDGIAVVPAALLGP